MPRKISIKLTKNEVGMTMKAICIAQHFADNWDFFGYAQLLRVISSQLPKKIKELREEKGGSK